MGFPRLYVPSWGGASSVVRAGMPLVADLADQEAQDAALTGGKASALAIAAAAGLKTLPGLVLTTAFSKSPDDSLVRDLFTVAGGGPLVARSSSVIEDTAESSMAGQFDSVLDITSADELVAAVHTVLDSRHRAGASDAPIAVLIQPFLEPAFGGVLFGVDPVSGRTDRRVVSVVRGGPDALVSGRANGARYVLDASGHAIDAAIGDGPKLRPRHLRRLARLAANAAAVFGSPQDVEWALGSGGRLWLLQSRPVTTQVNGAPVGPVYGPGPVAETFPSPLSRLEEDLWVPPLREAVGEAVQLAGAASRDAVRGSKVVFAIDGRVVIDLALAGDMPTRRSTALHPLRAAASIRTAWRVGRLRAALPRLAEHLLERADDDLSRVPALTDLSVRELTGLLHRGQAALRALHAHEILMGMLIDTGATPVTGAAVALRVLAAARVDGLDDAAIARRSPVVLALTAPRIGTPVELPDVPLGAGPAHEGDVDDAGIIREALRLRVRWVQELTARAAAELGVRLMEQPSNVRHLTLADVDAIVDGRATPAPSLIASRGDAAALPLRFQLTDRGKVVAVDDPAGEASVGTGAGGGRGRGIVTHDATDPADGSVLVTTTLSPGLGPLLPRLRGIVAETGSVLSHLAILAREFGVPTVVAYRGALAELPEGALVEVDGDRGHVAVLGEESDR